MLTLPNGLNVECDDLDTDIVNAMKHGNPALIVRADGCDTHLYLGTFDAWTVDRKAGLLAYDDGQAFARPITQAERESIETQSRAEFWTYAPAYHPAI